MIMKLKMEILIWKLVHRALLLAVGSAILAFGISCRGAKVLYQAEELLNPTNSFVIPRECAGHTATVWAVCYKQGENIKLIVTLYGPDGQAIGVSEANYNNKYENTSKKTQCVLNRTLVLQEGTYSITLDGKSEKDVIAKTESILVICWDCAGDDATILQQELTGQLDNLRQELNGKIDTETRKLQDQISNLQKALNDAIGDHDRDQAELLKKIEEYKKELADSVSGLQQKLSELEAKQAEYLSELEKLKQKHDQDIAAVNARIDELAAQYAKDAAGLNARLDEITESLKGLEESFGADGGELKEQIEKLTETQTTLQHQIEIIERQHSSDMSAVQQKIDSETARIQAAHDADIKQIQQSISHLDEKFSTENARLENSIEKIDSRLEQLQKEYAAGNLSLKEQIDALKYQQLSFENQLSNLSQTHSRDVAALQTEIREKTEALSGKIDTAVADFRQELVSLNNTYREKAGELKNELEAVNSKLESEVDKLNAADRELFERIADLRVQQAEYNSRLETLKAIHEKDMEAYRKEQEELDADYRETAAEIQARIDALEQEAVSLRAQHEADVQAIRKQIEAVSGELNEDIKALYDELEKQQQALDAHKQEVLAEIDKLQLQITALDDAMTARLKSLENRIKYAVYSDEKLEALEKEYAQLVQAKETEIANIDLEIEELRKLGLDAGAKEEIRNLKLQELTALRNELSDIRFAIRLRHDDSEFAAHEKEIEWLKEELAALRNSADLQVKQLEEKLAEAEKKFQELLEQLKNEAGATDAELKQQIADLQGKIDELTETLRNEQLAGDDALKKQLEELDAAHKELLEKLDHDMGERLDRLKYEFDTQFENLRSSINNVAYQQRFSNGNGSSSYGLPSVQAEEVPADTRDMRVSPDLMLEI